ncbi:MAG TPA: ATP-binding cassette domain-containing protein [Microlunatus sp.]
MDVSKSYDGRPVLRDVALTVEPGQVLGVSGPSGSGKTTLLHVIAGLEDPDRGSVRLSGVTLTDADVLVVQDRRNLMLAGQDAVLDRDKNVAATIATALPSDKKRRRVGAHRVAMVLDLLELDTTLADSRPAQLSAGERQRVALARAIVGFGLGGPEAAVLLDEPLSAVEIGTRIRLLQAVLTDVGRQPIPVLLVSHDPDEIAAVAGRRVALVEGRLIPG